MLNMGFQEDVEKILNLIKQQNPNFAKVQMLMFSATLPGWVHDIVSKYMKPNKVLIDLVKNTDSKTSKNVEHLAINCPYTTRSETIADIVMCYGGYQGRTIIFCEKKTEANEILLNSKLKCEPQVLHGDIPQKQREITF